MTNLKKYSDDELSLVVFNDEYWYSKRHLPTGVLVKQLEQVYEFTAKQRKVLIADIKADLEECARYDSLRLTAGDGNL